MQGWITGFQESINFIEQNLTEELNNEEIASMAALSWFYYQRIFGALCGMLLKSRYGSFCKLLCGWVLSQQLTVSVWTIKNKNNLIKPIDIVGE